MIFFTVVYKIKNSGKVKVATFPNREFAYASHPSILFLNKHNRVDIIHLASNTPLGYAVDEIAKSISLDSQKKIYPLAMNMISLFYALAFNTNLANCIMQDLLATLNNTYLIPVERRLLQNIIEGYQFGSPTKHKLTQALNATKYVNAFNELENIMPK